MAFIHRLGQSVGDAGPNPDHCGLLDAEPHGDGVRRLEANAADIARQPIRVLRHHLDSVGAIGFEDTHRPRSTDAMAMKEDHDFAHDLLFGPGDSNAAGPHWTDASTSRSRSGSASITSNTLSPKTRTSFLA